MFFESVGKAYYVEIANDYMYDIGGINFCLPTVYCSGL